VREPLPISSSTLVTAGGLVFYGTGDGWIKALDARTGRILWKHRADGRRLDQPVSYRGADGHQYIAVRALPRAAGHTPGDGGAAVLLFALAH
jgi:outer membrane protein assembly factor BamB